MSTPGDGFSQQQWNAPTQAGPPPVPQQPRNGMGTAALVFGILAVLTCWFPVVGFVLGVVAIVFGVIGRGRVKRMEATNGGVAIAGLVLGILSVLVNILVSIVLGAGVFAFFSSGGGQSLDQFRQCVTNAPNAGSPAAVQQAYEQCQQQFQQQLPQVPGGQGG